MFAGLKERKDTNVLQQDAREWVLVTDEVIFDGFRLVAYSREKQTDALMVAVVLLGAPPNKALRLYRIGTGEPTEKPPKLPPLDDMLKGHIEHVITKTPCRLVRRFPKQMKSFSWHQNK